MPTYPRNRAPKHTLFTCLALSLALHVVALSALKSHPLLFYRSSKPSLGVAPMNALLAEDPPSTSAMLEEVFDRMILPSPHVKVPFDLPNIHVRSSRTPLLEAMDATPLFAEDLCPPDQERAAHRSRAVDPGQALSYSPVESLLRFPHIMAPEIAWEANEKYALPPIAALPPEDAPSKEVSFLPPPASPTQEPHSELQLEVADCEELFLRNSTLSEAPQLTLPEREERALQANVFVKHLPLRVPFDARVASLDHYAFPQLAAEFDWSDDFAAETRCFRRENDWLFSLSLSPKHSLEDYQLPQHFLFVLDRTNPGNRQRFHAYQRAVLKSLTKLQKSDTFNIAILDKKPAQFSPVPVRVSLKTLRAVEEFLEKEQPSRFFSGSDFVFALDHCLLNLRAHEAERVSTVILLSDGNWSTKFKEPHAFFMHWASGEAPKNYIHTAAVGEHNDLVALDLFSQCNGGRMIWSDTHAAFPRKVAKLVLDLHHPILTDVKLSIALHHPGSKIEFLNPSPQLPALRGNHTYALLGRANAMVPFDFTMMGCRGGEWVTITKTISLDEETVDAKLEKAAKKQNLYKRFLAKGKESDLKEARELCAY